MFDNSIHKSRDSLFCACEKKNVVEILFDDMAMVACLYYVKESKEQAQPTEQISKCNAIWDFISMTLQLCFAFYYYRFFGTQRTIVTHNIWKRVRDPH